MDANTTKLIVEYLVAGILTVVSIILAAMSLFPDTISDLLAKPLLEETTLAAQIGLTSIFIATAYAVGIVAEYVGEQLLEWWFSKIKRKRIDNYLINYGPELKNTVIFKSYFDPELKKKQSKKDLKEYIGEMRFYVMNHSAPLYADIAAQINRLRLIRALFLVELILLVAVGRQLYLGYSIQWRVIIGLIFAIAAANLFAIKSRFGRYCRSVERSYLILMMDQNLDASKEKIND